MGRFIQDFRDGIGSYAEGASLISRHRLWIYFVIPGIISLVFGGLIIWGAIGISGQVADFVASKYPWESGVEIVKRIAGILAALLIAGGAVIIYKYVVLILVAPFMSPLSEKIEQILTGAPGPRSFIDPVQLIRGLRVTLRNLLRELFFTIVVLIVTAIVPFIAILSGPLILSIQSYYAGFGNMDFTLERHFGVRGSVRFVRRCKGVAVGNGLIFLLLLMIPVIGLFFAPGLSTAAGAIETVKRIPVKNYE